MNHPLRKCCLSPYEKIVPIFQGELGENPSGKQISRTGYKKEKKFSGSQYIPITTEIPIFYWYQESRGRYRAGRCSARCYARVSCPEEETIDEIGAATPD